MQELNCFRTKAILEDGQRVYITSQGRILCRPSTVRETAELYQRGLICREEIAFSPELHEFKPVWCFQHQKQAVRVHHFENEEINAPYDPLAILDTGDQIAENPNLFYMAGLF